MRQVVLGSNQTRAIAKIAVIAVIAKETLINHWPTFSFSLDRLSQNMLTHLISRCKYNHNLVVVV